jgi:hypothetical protein
LRNFILDFNFVNKIIQLKSYEFTANSANKKCYYWSDKE